jgi:MFS family permease
MEDIGGWNGLSYTEMGMVFAVSAITIGTLDFPTGNFAERYGRKRSVVLVVLSVAFGMTLYGEGYTDVWLSRVLKDRKF